MSSKGKFSFYISNKFSNNEDFWQLEWSKKSHTYTLFTTSATGFSYHCNIRGDCFELKTLTTAFDLPFIIFIIAKQTLTNNDGGVYSTNPPYKV